VAWVGTDNKKLIKGTEPLFKLPELKAKVI
jgi:hypothetical protein